jgi:light-regulated signal transduction histidine kinase (bacteriophytochrome)
VASVASSSLVNRFRHDRDVAVRSGPTEVIQGPDEPTSSSPTTASAWTSPTQQRIFDPFFTTKEVGKGTGQGLSMAYATIVQKHGGAIYVESSPGAGAQFTISIPTSLERETLD